MKLLRVGPKGKEKPGMADDDGRLRDLSAHTWDFAGDAVSLEAIDAVRKVEKTTQERMSGLASGLNIPGLNLPL